jgi:hypothetical protein
MSKRRGEEDGDEKERLDRDGEKGDGDDRGW